MVKSTSGIYLIIVCTIFLTKYDARNVAQTSRTGQNMTQSNESLQDVNVNGLEEHILKIFGPQGEIIANDFTAEFDASNRSEGQIIVPNVSTEFDTSNRSIGTPFDMADYLALMVASVKLQQKIRKADDDLKMHEAFYEAKVPDSVVGVYERNQNGLYKHVCSGAIINYFHVITAASCVWNESTSQVKDPSSFLIVAGRTAYPDEINDVNVEPEEQRFNASHLLVPNTFTGTTGNSQNNLAVVRLATVVRKTNNVVFITVDWASEFYEEPNNGVQEGLFVDSENAMEDGIRYANVSACVDPERALNITSSDKRCSRSTGQQVSSVNLGAPFVVYHHGKREHFLRGVLSWTYGDLGTSVVEFTDINNEKTLMWINEAATGQFDPPANYKELHLGFYSWNKENKTWLEAKAFCESNGNYSYLAFPTKENEYDLMVNMMGGQVREAWVGFSDREQEGDIVSLFGMNVDTYEWAQWMDAGNVTKSEDNADCVVLTNADGQQRPGMMTSPCDERRPFICGFCLECALLDSAFGETQGVSRYLAYSTLE